MLEEREVDKIKHYDLILEIQVRNAIGPKLFHAQPFMLDVVKKKKSFMVLVSSSSINLPSK